MKFKNFILTNLLSVGGFLLFVISLLISWGNLIDYDIFKNGFEVTAKVIEAPLSCNKVGKRGGYCKLEYQGKIYVEKAGKKFCHLVSGKKEARVLTNNDGDKLLFIGEFNDFEFASGFVIMLISIFIIIKGYKPNNS